MAYLPFQKGGGEEGGRVWGGRGRGKEGGGEGGREVEIAWIRQSSLAPGERRRDEKGGSKMMSKEGKIKDDEERRESEK